MAASYPASLPVKDPAGANLSTNPHSALHDGMYDEIVAIATELGTNPKGTAASVKARFDALPSVQAAATSLALDGLGRGTITFPAAFTTAPAIVVSVVLATSATMTVHVVSKSESNFLVQVDADGTPVASATRQVNWMAVGTLA